MTMISDDSSAQLTKLARMTSLGNFIFWEMNFKPEHFSNFTLLQT